MPKLPNFIIAGFPKCGTTSLFAYLREHPEVFLPERKEMNYFTNEIIKKLNSGPGDQLVNDTQVKTFEEYKKHYQKIKNEKVIGDASPSYINFPDCYLTIKEKLNNPKIIIVLRDPIKRTYSNYLHLYKTGRETLSFYEALSAEEERKSNNFSPFWYYKNHSLYYKKIVEANFFFTDVLIITQEELNNDTKSTLSKVFEFLKIDKTFIPKNLNVRYNTGGVYAKNPITNFFIRGSKLRVNLINKFPIIKKLKPLKDKILDRYQVSPPTLDLKSEEFLISFFKEDVRNLKDFGVDVSQWNNKFLEN